MSTRQDRRPKLSATVTRLTLNPDDCGSSFVPPGKYELSFRRYCIVRRFDRDVLELWFAIQDFGPYFGVLLPRYYNITGGKGQRFFRAKPNSAFSREYCALFGQRPKFNAAPIARFESVIVEGLIEVVSRDYRQASIPKEARYSTIRELRRVI